jgi:hypothetical protein
MQARTAFDSFLKHRKLVNLSIHAVERDPLAAVIGHVLKHIQVSVSRTWHLLRMPSASWQQLQGEYVNQAGFGPELASLCMYCSSRRERTCRKRTRLQVLRNANAKIVAAVFGFPSSIKHASFSFKIVGSVVTTVVRLVVTLHHMNFYKVTCRKTPPNKFS